MINRLLATLALFVLFSALHAQDGTLDGSFGIDGIITMDINNSNDAMKSILTQPDGKIIVAGYSSDMEANMFCLLRFNGDGTIDDGFGSNGVVITTFPYTSIASEIALQSDGKIIAAGHTWGGSQNNFALARYNPDGTLDSSFGNSGTVSTSFPERSGVARTLKIQDNGKIIAGGHVYTLYDDFDEFALARYNTDGSLDLTFGSGGQVTTSFGAGTRNWINSIQIQENGKIVAGGFSNYSGALARYNSTGALDLSFGSNGLVTTDVPNTTQGLINALAISPDGSIFAGGYSVDTLSDFTVVKYDSQGIPDNTFGVNGILVTQISSENDAITDILIQPDHKILVGGNTSENSVSHFALARFDGTGDPDPTFGTNGVVITQVDPIHSHLESINLQSNGKILAAGHIGNFPFDIALVRYSSTILSTINRATSLDNISIFPNPTTDKLQITFTLKHPGYASIKLFDGRARLLQEEFKTFVTPGVINTETLQLESYAAGIYFIGIGTRDAHKMFKIVKE